MLHYRAYLLDERRHVISAANLYCADEQAAKERAQQLVHANDVELWQLEMWMTPIGFIKAARGPGARAAPGGARARPRWPRAWLSRRADSICAWLIE